MTTYKEIFGKQIKQLSTDPTDAQAEGQIWFNTTQGVFKSVVAGDAWSSTAPLTTQRNKPGGLGIQTASLIFGGSSPSTSSDEYDGSTFKTAPVLNTGREGMASGGTISAGWKAGGNPPSTTNATEEYDGSSWTTVPGTLNTGRYIMGSCGVQTAGLACGGYNGTNVNASEEYNGTSWAEGNNLNTTRRTLATFGTQTAAISTGGQEPPNAAGNASESYDGTSWTSINNNPISVSDLGAAGTQTAGLVFGGYTSPTPQITTTNKFDGTNFSLAPSMGNAASRNAGVGTQSAALSAGSTTPNPGFLVEEFNVTANTIIAGAFSSLPTLNTARWGLGGAGTKSAAIVFGGRNPPVGQDLALSEEYNGTSWSEGPDLNTATRVCGRGTGTSTAALKHGGHSGSPSTSNKTAEEWNGSSWSNGGASTNNHDGTMQIGTQTAAASCGSNPPTGAKTEEYNGTSWTASNDMPYSAYQGSASGSQTAGVVFGGGYPAKNNSAEYDGTNWTAGNTLIQTTVGQGGNGGSGTQALAIGAGGYTPGPTYLTSAFTYDGTNFATSPSLATARQEVAAQGANTSFYVAGGLTSPGAATNVVEEFTPESTTLNIKTLTSS